ncbi:MAG: hypothetical protein WBW81_04710 [Methylocella sp.]
MDATIVDLRSWRWPISKSDSVGCLMSTEPALLEKSGDGELAQKSVSALE